MTTVHEILQTTDKNALIEMWKLTKPTGTGFKHRSTLIKGGKRGNSINERVVESDPHGESFEKLKFSAGLW